MFGLHNIPFEFKKDDISLSFYNDAGGYHYERDCKGDLASRTIISNKKLGILLNPVEPVNTPKAITDKFQIEFNEPYMVGPKITKKIYLRYPMEIGVFIGAGKDFEKIDIFSLVPQKFTMYGEHRLGHLCRHWKSEVLDKIPATDPLYEGVMELTISNITGSWVDITKVVFNACGMTEHYSKDLVSMKARMNILQPHLAITEFINEPIRKGMKKSMELYTPGTVTLFEPKFTMAGLR